MKQVLSLIVAAVVSSLMLLACSADDESPTRDQYPIVNARVFDLQVAVISRNPAHIDSLLSKDILKLDQGSDSLLGYIYGPGRDRAFSRFDVRGIIQTDKLARVDCSLIDTSGAVLDQSISLTYQLYHDSIWLLKRFDPVPEDAKVWTDTVIDSQ